jgi:glycosyltransferase involved in cell wall biosynthesis
MKRRVFLQVVNSLFPVGGAETAAVSLAVHASPNWEPHVLCLRDAVSNASSPLEQLLAAEGIPVHRIAMGGLRDVASGLSLAALLRRIDAVAVNAHNRPSDGWLMLWAAAARVPVRVYTRQLTYPDVTPSMRRRYRLAAMAAHRVVAISSAVAGHLAREEETPEAKIVVIPNGVDPARFDTSSPEARERGAALRAAWGIAEDAPVVGALCRLSDQKGLDVFLDVAAQVLAVEPRTRFAVVGEGEARLSLENKARALGIGKSVVFPGFHVPEHALAAFDVYLTTARYEGIQLTLLEAMSSRLPVVGPRIGPFPEVVEHEVTGLLPTPGVWVPIAKTLDPGLFAAAVIRLLRNPGLRASLGEAARKRIEEAFSLSSVVRRYEGLYTYLYEKGGRG